MRPLLSGSSGRRSQVRPRRRPDEHAVRFRGRVPFRGHVAHFAYSSVGGRPSRFHPSALFQRAHAFGDPLWLLWDARLRAGILRPAVWGATALFSTVAAPFFVPAGVVLGSSSSAASATLVILRVSDDGHPGGRGAASRCGFDWHFPNDRWCRAPPACSFAIRMSSELHARVYPQKVCLFSTHQALIGCAICR